MAKFLQFLNTGAGLLLLGFLVTTIGGAIISGMIQTRSLDRERNFELYKIRLTEAKILQEQLLEHSTKRFFYLSQVMTKARAKNETPEQTRKYWVNNYSKVKNIWNENIINFHSKLIVLFNQKTSNLLLCCDENKFIVDYPMLQKLDEETYNTTKPKSLHGAFINAHATAYHIVFECTEEKKKCKEWGDLIKLAKKQLDDLELLHNCLAYAIAGELLVDPYGSKEEFVMPKNCRD